MPPISFIRPRARNGEAASRRTSRCAMARMIALVLLLTVTWVGIGLLFAGAVYAL